MWGAVDPGQQKEQFSKAYVRAVVATAGYTVSVPEVDEDSVDFTVHTRGVGGLVRSPTLDVQVKCTEDARERDPIPFRLWRKNYVDLQGDDFAAPRILVVVFVPSDVDAWLDHSEHRLALSHCGYWVSLRNAPPLGDDAQSATVYLPRHQQFCVGQLTSIVVNLSKGAPP
jgi:hypothetical protein